MTNRSRIVIRVIPLGGLAHCLPQLVLTNLELSPNLGTTTIRTISLTTSAFRVSNSETSVPACALIDVMIGVHNGMTGGELMKASHPRKSLNPAGSMTRGCPTRDANDEMAERNEDESIDGRGCRPRRRFIGAVEVVVEMVVEEERVVEWDEEEDDEEKWIMGRPYM